MADKHTAPAGGPLTSANMNRTWAMLLKQGDAARASRGDWMRWLVKAAYPPGDRRGR